MTTHETTRQTGPGGDEGFVPRGAIAFLVLMVILYAALWLVFYSILIGRS
jgi:hypothetical protein